MEDVNLREKNKILAPCPFCGNDDNTVIVNDYVDDTNKRHYFGYCCNCESTGPEAQSEKTAIEMWNERLTMWGGCWSARPTSEME